MAIRKDIMQTALGGGGSSTSSGSATKTNTKSTVAASEALWDRGSNSSSGSSNANSWAKPHTDANAKSMGASASNPASNRLAVTAPVTAKNDAITRALEAAKALAAYEQAQKTAAVGNAQRLQKYTDVSASPASNINNGFDFNSGISTNPARARLHLNAQRTNPEGALMASLRDAVQYKDDWGMGDMVSAFDQYPEAAKLYNTLQLNEIYKTRIPSFTDVSASPASNITQPSRIDPNDISAYSPASARLRLTSQNGKFRW